MNNNNNELVQYFIVNKELNLSSGKLAAQVAHVATIITLKYQNTEEFKEWFSGSQTKIIVQGKEKDLRKLIDKGMEYIIDEGRTEIAENSLTVVGLPPMTRDNAKQYIKRLQIYKG